MSDGEEAGVGESEVGDNEEREREGQLLCGGRVQRRWREEEESSLLSNRLLDEKIRFQVNTCGCLVEDHYEVISEQSTTESDELRKEERKKRRERSDPVRSVESSERLPLSNVLT